MQVKVGTYTGNGADSRAITGVGFQPDVVWIKGGANETVIRTSSMSGDLSKQMATAAALAANLVQSLDAGGFTIGDDARVNANGTVYYYLALRDDGDGDLKVSTYTGNATDNTNITGVGFQPQVVFVMPANAILTAWTMNPADLTTRSDGVFTNLIQGFGADGFQLGDSTSINANTIVYHYIAIKDAASIAKIGTYTGNGADNRDITGVGFDPDFVFTQKDTATHRVPPVRFKDNTGDESALVSASAFTTDLIQGFVTDGFQIGTSVNVNTNTAAYHYLAFAETTSGGTAYKDAGIRTRLAVRGFKDVATRLRLRAGAFKDVATRFRLRAGAFKDAATRTRIAARSFKDASIRFRLRADAYKDAGVRFVLALGDQFARPAADVSNDNWTNELGATTGLYASIDEVTADDADYIQSAPSPVDWEEYKVRIGDLVDPAVTTGHTIRIQYKKDLTGGDRIDLMVSLYRADGTTLITQQGFANIDALTTVDIDLSEPNADDIPYADYPDLVIGFAAINNTGGGGVPPWL